MDSLSQQSTAPIHIPTSRLLRAKEAPVELRAKSDKVRGLVQN